MTVLPAPYEGPPLTILAVGNYRHPFCSEVHFASSLEQEGHRVHRLQEHDLDFNRLHGEARRVGAQVVMWTRTISVDNDAALGALRALAADGIPTIAYHLDRWHGLEREYQLDSEAFFRCALVVSPDGSPVDWAGRGINHMWAPPGVFGAECIPVGQAAKLRQKVEPIIFVGSYPYPHPAWAPVRQRVIEGMQARYGADFGLWPKNRHRPVRNLELTSLYQQAQVVVGDSCLVGNPTAYWSDRIPETLGRGGVLVHPRVDGLPEMYVNGEHLRTYPAGNVEQLIEVVDFLLDDDEKREAIRAQGQALVLSRDTYRHRMASVLGHVQRTLGIPDPKPLATGGPVSASALPLVVGQPARITPKAVRYSKRPRITHRFALAQGDTDRIAVDEVWTADDYRASELVKPGMVVVDIGANVGAFSVLAAKLGARVVHAYEPHPATRAVLAANVHGLAVHVHEEAVVGASDVAAPWALTGDGGGAHLAYDGEIPVSVIRACDVQANIGPADVWKLDAEMAELEIIPALDLTMIGAICAEMHGPVMPHLTSLNEDGLHLDRWKTMIAHLAAYGRLEIVGRPMVGGLIRWARY